jgi:hypothetical protein
MEELDVRVSDKAILVNGAQVSWTLKIHKLDELYECLENRVLDVNTEGDAYAHGEAEVDPRDMRSLDDDDDDVAWK